MTEKISMLCAARKIKECPVGLSDSSSAEATHEGNVILPGNLTLHNVLFVPNLDCNLISIL